METYALCAREKGGNVHRFSFQSLLWSTASHRFVRIFADKRDRIDHVIKYNSSFLFSTKYLNSLGKGRGQVHYISIHHRHEPPRHRHHRHQKRFSTTTTYIYHYHGVIKWMDTIGVLQ